MENIGAIGEFINNYGFAAVLLAFVLLKDWKFTASIDATLKEINNVLASLQTWHAKEDEKQ